MLTFLEYLARSIVFVACVASVSWGARCWQWRFLPEWVGPERLIARVVAGLTVCLTVSYVTGLVGLFTLVVVVPLLLASGPIAQWRWKASAPDVEQAELPPAWVTAVAGATLALGLTGWMLPINQAMNTGMAGTDTLWYHMPYALDFFQSGSLLKIFYAEPLFETYFYPLGGSVFHALGMVFFHRDFLSPFVNLAWLGLALLAGAAIGRSRGVAAAATLGVAAVMFTNAIVSSSAAGAMVDTPATFFLLAAIAIHLRDPDGRAATLLTAAAIGMGLSVKLTIAIPVAAFTAVVLLRPGTETRLRTAGAWFGGLALTSSFWFVRNLIATGSPLPLLNLPLFSQPSVAGVETSNMRSIADIASTHTLLKAVPRGWESRLGPFWPVLVFGALAALIVLVVSPKAKGARGAAIVGLAAFIGYFFTPGTAAGPPGGPIRGYAWDTRFLAPGIAVGLALLPVALARFAPKWRHFTVIPMAALAVAVSLTSNIWSLRWNDATSLSLLVPSLPPAKRFMHIDTLGPLIASTILVGVAILVWLGWRRVPTRRLNIAWLITAIVAIIGGWIVGNSYMSARAFGYRAQVPTRGDLRVGIVGTAGVFNQYLMSGNTLGNQFFYIGVSGPHGSFRTISTCVGVRKAINRAHLDYVIAAPTRNIWSLQTEHNFLRPFVHNSGNSKFIRWLPALRNNYSVNTPGQVDRFALYKITGSLSPAACPFLQHQASLARKTRK